MQHESHRMERVDAHLQRRLGELIAEEYDVGNDLVTVSRVRTTRDLRQADVYLVASDRTDEHVAALQQLAPRLQDTLKPELNFKAIPRLTFRNDAEQAEITRVEELLEDLREQE
ncbi:MAG: ribosome-binding factor A [Patescibacteria group bacterium]|jgi:ribosome-binding factor A